MNEEAIKDGYNYFVQTGYTGTIDDYKLLLKQNNDAFNDTYKYFVNTGYNGTVEDFQTLVGVTEVDVTDTEKKNSKSSQEVEEMLVSGIPEVQDVDGTLESSESKINQDNTAQPDPNQNEQDVDQDNTAQPEVNVDEQEVDQSQGNQQKVDQEILDRFAAIQQVEQEWWIKRAKGNKEQAALDFSTTTMGDLNEAELNEFMTLGGLDAVPTEDDNYESVEIIQPQTIVTRTEPGNKTALKWGAGGAIGGSYFGPWGTAIGGTAGLLGGAVYDSPLGNTIKNIFKGQDSSGENAYERGTYESTADGERVDPELKRYIESDDQFTQSLQHVSPGAIADPESSTIPLMEYHFTQHGYHFEPTDAMGDGMNVYGYKKEGDKWFKVKHYVNLDRLWSKKSTAKALRDFLEENRADTRTYAELTKGDLEKQTVFHDQDQVDRTVKKMTEREDVLRDNIKDYLRKVRDYNTIKDLPPEEVIYIEDANGKKVATTPAALLQELNFEQNKLVRERDNLIEIGSELDRDIGLWYMLRGQQGSRSGSFFQNMTAGGGSDIGSFGMDFVIDAGVSLAYAIDEDATGGLSPDEMKKQIKFGQDGERPNMSPFSQYATRTTQLM